MSPTPRSQVPLPLLAAESWVVGIHPSLHSSAAKSLYGPHRPTLVPVPFTATAHSGCLFFNHDFFHSSISSILPKSDADSLSMWLTRVPLESPLCKYHLCFLAWGGSKSATQNLLNCGRPLFSHDGNVSVMPYVKTPHLCIKSG